MEERFFLSQIFLCPYGLEAFYEKSAIKNHSSSWTFLAWQIKVTMKIEMYFSNMNKIYSITTLSLQLRLETVEMMFCVPR